MTPAERIIRIIAYYFGAPVVEVNLDTVLRTLTDHDIDDLDIREIVGDVEEAFVCEIDDAKLPAASQPVTVRDFLRLVEPEGVGS